MAWTNPAIRLYWVIWLATRHQTLSVQQSYEPFQTTPELINRHGYPVESHTLVTEDGYQLTLHRIPYSAKFRRRHSPLDNNPLNSNEAGTESEPRGGRTDYAFETSGKPAVFLQHGVLASSLDWVLTGPHKALGYKLSDAGYDVWMGNLRGTIYSTRHKNFSNTQPEFWNYSWHEIGMYDLPAMVDYVLRVTGHPDLYFVGHSMGATVAVVMLSERPQYNDKLKITILLAPVVKLQHNTSIFRHSAPLWKALQGVSSYSGLHGFPPNPQLIQRRLEPVCEEQYIGRGLCANILHTVAGYSKELNQTLLPVLFGHYPTQTSTRTLSHFLQGMNTGKFSKYDYGLEDNMALYNHAEPSEYILGSISSPVAIFCGDSDPFTDPQDVSWLADQFPNLVGNYLVPSESFSHLSFLWATNVDEILYDPMIRLLDRYKLQ
ncbi:lipase 3-like [Zootermopsis nevadensis]|uniref:lipase 3-like n=1 Tax=Zootermopsis nevadensis TaxID=136037 RepID=UPI000B8E8DAC|nr:lipase 3-like [Zootermopsis nevadensis]